MRDIRRPIEILLVEDNPGDVRLTIEALKDGKVENHLVVARDGVEALAMIHQDGANGDALSPDLVLLDLDLPHKDGRAVLAELRADPRFASLPVVILSASRDEQDRIEGEALGATAYMTKPVDVHQLIDVVQEVAAFRLSIVTVPTTASATPVLA